MKLLKVYVSDDFKKLVDQIARTVGMSTSSFIGTLLKESLAGLDGNTNTEVPEELSAATEHKSADQTEPVVVSPFLEDYKEEMSRIEEQIDSMCYYIAQNKYQLVSDDVMQSLHEKLDEIGTLFAAIYKKCCKEEDLTTKRMKGDR